MTLMLEACVLHIQCIYLTGHLPEVPPEEAAKVSKLPELKPSTSTSERPSTSTSEQPLTSTSEQPSTSTPEQPSTSISEQEDVKPNFGPNWKAGNKVT